MAAISFWPQCDKSRSTHSNQSTATIKLISFVGRPTADNTSNIVTNPALGTLAAPMLANVAVKLERNGTL